MDTKERIMEYIRYKKTQTKQFEERCMLSNIYISMAFEDEN